MSGLLGLLAMMMLNMGLDSLSSDDEADTADETVGNDSSQGITNPESVGSLLDDFGDPMPEDPEPDPETTVLLDDFGNPLPPVSPPESEIILEYDDYGYVMDSEMTTFVSAEAEDPATETDIIAEGQGLLGPSEADVTISETAGTTGDESSVGMAPDGQIFGKEGDDTLNDADSDETLNRGEADGGSDGGAGNDSLYIGSGDIAIKGGGEDSFVTGDWVEDSEPPVITDFATTQDQLVVMYDPSDATAPDIAITSTAEGDLLVSLSGQTIARLVGDTTGFSLDNVSLVAM